MAVGQYALTTLQTLKDWLKITDSASDTVLERLIDSTTARIESYCGRKFKARQFVEFRDPDGLNLKLQNWPVTACSFLGYGRETAMVIGSTVTTDVAATVTVSTASPFTSNYALVLTRTAADGTTEATTLLFATYLTVSQLAAAVNATTGFTASVAVDGPTAYLHRVGPIDCTRSTAALTLPSERAADYRIDLNAGVVRLPIGFRSRDDWADGWYDSDQPQTVVIEYTAGFSTIPDDVAQACVEIAAAAYRARFMDANVESESIGDYSYTSAVRTAGEDLLDSLLSEWRDIR